MPRFRFQTEHLDVDTARCTACGACVDACTRDVLSVEGIQFLFNDKHVHVGRLSECDGCGRCVSSCAHGALRKTRSGSGGQ